jgi:glycosyltransferase involved in cell wall biosynthesis
MSNKVLYIGNYRDGTGWGNACLNNILAMDNVGINVIPRAVSYEARQIDYPERIKQLEAKSSYGCNICIQHVLPHLLSYNANYKNIGFLAVETSPFKLTGWTESLNLMDEIWVPSLECKGHCRMSGVKVPIYVVPHSLNISEYQTHKSIGGIKEIDNTFNFLFIGEFIERKNVKALIQSFHAEFYPEEPVNLVLKTSKANASMVQKYCDGIKARMKLRKSYKKEIVLSGMLEDKMYKSIIKQCHRFVMPSRGEAFCIPALESMACGVPVIWTKNTGIDDFGVGRSVDSTEQPCFGAIDTVPNLDNYGAYWREIDLRGLQFAMREAYMKWKSKEADVLSKKAMKEATKMDHTIVGKTIKELLNDS